MSGTKEMSFSLKKNFFSLKYSLLCLIIGIIVAYILLQDEGNSIKKDGFRKLTNTNIPYKDISTPIPNFYEQNDITNFFAVVIDAGSTGTRLHLFHSIHEGTTINPTTFTIESETFLEVKPGLSNFANNPKEAALKVKILIEKAQQTIPKHLWKDTPVTFKATAGLRLLKDNKANDILEKVSEVLKDSGFILFENSVNIMPGINEGVYAWITLNFLTNRVEGVVFNNKTEKLPIIDKNSTAATMDLGGGSTQLTFLPNDLSIFDNIKNNIDDYIFKTNFFGKNIQLYSHSYLGNGLVASRLGVSLLHEKSNENYLKTPCLPHNFNLEKWNYGDNNWTVNGVIDSSFDKCLELNKIYIEQITEVKPMKELLEKDIFGFSYFYDRGLQAGLIPNCNKQLGGYVKVIDYKNAAKQKCTMKKEDIGPEHWKPWQCHDLTYIYTLLHYGYGLPEDKKIYLAKKLRGMEMSWALGASYDLLTTYYKKHIF
ncbi:NTPase [Strongyloides ratti]|uniref:NTPase n=1 Tax=Strongyloides ratti TaxID=34506 RepID=A0A090KSD4_STRRB|nr:NTPase [Strongyloides ratti]CEF60425.1 NTPase [Strongyloides ratti]